MSNVVSNCTVILFIYMKNKAIKNNVNSLQNFFLQLFEIYQFFRSRARENRMLIIRFDRVDDALSNCVKIRNFQCST
jgi:hypothetical protein